MDLDIEFDKNIDFSLLNQYLDSFKEGVENDGYFNFFFYDGFVIFVLFICLYFN